MKNKMATQEKVIFLKHIVTQVGSINNNDCMPFFYHKDIGILQIDSGVFGDNFSTHYFPFIHPSGRDIKYLGECKTINEAIEKLGNEVKE